MEPMFKVINEFEARRGYFNISEMEFSDREFDIYQDELEDFLEYGYKVEFVESTIKYGEGLINWFSIKRAK